LAAPIKSTNPTITAFVATATRYARTGGLGDAVK